jgi:hypothetical protein
VVGGQTRFNQELVSLREWKIIQLDRAANKELTFFERETRQSI